MKPMFRKIAVTSLLLLCIPHLFSQVMTSKEFVKAVQAADVLYYYDENYEKAAGMYETLVKNYPDNLSITAKLGICYLNIQGKKSDALKLLIKASSKIVKNDREFIEFGEKAPLDTYLYLAIAYHQNDSLQKAIQLFYDAKKKLGGTKLFREEYIDKQIRDCRYAMEIEKKPLETNSDLFAPWLVEYPGASNPVLARNDSVFVFTYTEGERTSIFCSYKSNGWNRPIDITKQLGGNANLYSNSITGNGKLLIIYREDDVDGNLYYSQRKDSTWSKLKSLNINTIYWESHGFITPDGKTLYFASNRPGGEGDLDIWISEKGSDGLWKRPVNCGKVINTPYNENTPFYETSSNTLLFSSIGHVGLGGYDIFRSVKKDGKWSFPVGLPYPLNNTTENIFYIFNNNTTGFIASIFNEKEGSRNIYSIITEKQPNGPIYAQGSISLQDGMPIDPKQTSVQISDQKTGITRNVPLSDTGSFKFDKKPADFKLSINKIGSKGDTMNLNKKTNPQIKNRVLPDTGSFNLEIKPGDYKLYINHTGYKADTINLNIPTNYTSNFIPINASLIPEKVASGAFLAIKNITFEFDSYQLNEQAKLTLEILKSVLLNYPDLKIEVAGYTDVKGSTEYNYKLADNRAQSVIDYITASGIARSRFTKKAFGASNFAAINTKSDGSDFPEGRKYNRRATFGIINPQTGVVIQQETYTPERLREKSTTKYSIILKKSATNLPLDYFDNLNITETYFIKPVKVDSIIFYDLGVFYNKNDAAQYLKFAKMKGYKDAYVTTPYDITNELITLPDNTKPTYPNKLTKPSKQEQKTSSGKAIYSIQLLASKKQMNINQFKTIEGVREIISNDGYFRYVCGEYESYAKAKGALADIHKAGFKDAFIRDVNLLINK
jgi:outer membrane protein OmpA-like peptidoglycan-associated protein/tetratricopeptide (TPR) repeat protein